MSVQASIAATVMSIYGITQGTAGDLPCRSYERYIASPSLTATCCSPTMFNHAGFTRHGGYAEYATLRSRPLIVLHSCAVRASPQPSISDMRALAAISA